MKICYELARIIIIIDMILLKSRLNYVEIDEWLIINN